MRKFLFMMLLTVVGSIAISSCTEDAIQPAKNTHTGYPCDPNCDGGGAGGSEGKP
jgi:hypothetical protein